MRRTLIRYSVLLIGSCLLVACFSSNKKSNPILEKWVAEDESAAMQLSLISDTMELVVPAGLTLWYNEFLTGDYEISYQVAMLMEGGEFDRLSDLNCFWALMTRCILIIFLPVANGGTEFLRIIIH